MIARVTPSAANIRTIFAPKLGPSSRPGDERSGLARSGGGADGLGTAEAAGGDGGMAWAKGAATSPGDAAPAGNASAAISQRGERRPILVTPRATGSARPGVPPPPPTRLGRPLSG